MTSSKNLCQLTARELSEFDENLLRWRLPGGFMPWESSMTSTVGDF